MLIIWCSDLLYFFFLLTTCAVLLFFLASPYILFQSFLRIYFFRLFYFSLSPPPILIRPFDWFPSDLFLLFEKWWGRVKLVVELQTKQTNKKKRRRKKVKEWDNKIQDIRRHPKKSWRFEYNSFRKLKTTHTLLWVWHAQHVPMKSVHMHYVYVTGIFLDIFKFLI